MTSQRLAEIRKIYSDAEYAIKRYERIALEDQVAAINELRYAGHHVLEASLAEDESEIEDHIASARNHCRRAVNDAKDAAIVSQLEFFMPLDVPSLLLSMDADESARPILCARHSKSAFSSGIPESQGPAAGVSLMLSASRFARRDLRVVLR